MKTADARAGRRPGGPAPADQEEKAACVEWKAPPAASEDGGYLSPTQVEQRIRKLRIVAILRLDGSGLSSATAVDRATRLCETLAESGIRVVEFTINRPHALESIAGIAARLGDRVLVGGGTVLDESSVDAVADAGAQFCVSPHVGPSVVAACGRRGLLAVPGVLSPTEVVKSMSLGLGMVKLFPAEPLGPSYLAALCAPFGTIGFMPTGGIDHANAARWLAAGAVALGVGSSLVPPDGSLEGVAERARQLVLAVGSRSPAHGADALSASAVHRPE